MSESSREFREHPHQHWKHYTVGVMSASSDKNRPAMENTYEAGALLARLGMDGINGGYNMGGMGNFANGFREECRKMGFSDTEIGQHLKGVVYEKAVPGRTFNEQAALTKVDNLPARAGGIIHGSDAVIAVEGGAGTNIEGLLAAQNEWFNEQTQGPSHAPRPVILIESTKLIEDTIKLSEKRSPHTIHTLTKHVYVLAGHSNPSLDRPNGELGVATLKNDPEMKQKLEMLLEYFYLKREQTNMQPLDEARLNYLQKELFSADGQHHIFSIAEKITAEQHMHGLGEGI